MPRLNDYEFGEGHHSQTCGQTAASLRDCLAYDWRVLQSLVEGHSKNNLLVVCAIDVGDPNGVTAGRAGGAGRTTVNLVVLQARALEIALNDFSLENTLGECLPGRFIGS